MSYATPQDVYDLGFSARAFVVVLRPWNVDNGRSGDTIDIAHGVIRMAGHGYATSDLVEFVLIASGGALPGGAPPGVFLYPLPIDPVRFALSLTNGGAALTYSSAGSGWGLQIDPTRRLQRHLDDAAARIDEKLTANMPPINRDAKTGLYPQVLVGLNARMAARSAIPSMLFDVATFRAAVDRVFAMQEADDLMLATWLEGKPINVRPTDQTTGINENAARSGSRRPRRGFDVRRLGG
jgi:hypothetical protein